MPVTAFVYGNMLVFITDAQIDWTVDTIKVALATSSYTPDQDAHDYFNDVVANEISGTGYTADGQALGTPTRTYTGGTNTLSLDAVDSQWTSSSFTARFAVVYKDRGGAQSADELLSYVNFGGDETVSSGTFTIQWHTDGVIKIVAS